MATGSVQNSGIYPISCVRCRRRKIKCNKVKPCNHCVHKGTPCEFPSTYRNIPVHDEIAYKEDSTSEGSMDRNSSSSPSAVSKLEEELSQLRVKSSQLEKALEDLTKHNQSMSSEIRRTAENSEDNFRVKGETSEKGEKYYGPLSSNNMVEEMQDISENKATRNNTSNRHSWTTNSHNQQAVTDSDSETIEYSFHKKPLPWVSGKGADNRKNEHALRVLINNFFDTRSYDYFVCRKNTIEFVENHASMDEEDCEIDDELLVLHMILLLSIVRLTPAKYNELGRAPVNDHLALWREVAVLKKCLFRGFSSLRHNLLNESHVTVQAYILCIEWEFLEGRYEESWSMMFHSCSIAYALGLHVILMPNKYSNETSSHLASMQEPPSEFDTFEQYREDYFSNKLPRVRVWFALRYLSAQMCSILGRPNPILLQTSPVSLPSIDTSNPAEVKEQDKLINALLKSGLSECLRLSNLNLIESFMREISVENVLNIESKYREELEALTHYLSPQYQGSINSALAYIDDLTQLPSSFRSNDVRIDVLVLHVNRIKYLEPLLDIPHDTTILLAPVSESITAFLEHLMEIAQMFIKDTLPSITKGDANIESLRMQKIFTMKDPFLASYVYQGFVVIFIVLHTRANALVEFNDANYITRLGGSLQNLVDLHFSIAHVTGINLNLWSTKQLVLMQKIVEHTNALNNHFRNTQQSQSTFQGFGNDPQIAELLGNNLKDAFWVENPENSPYYLGVARDDIGMDSNHGTMMNDVSSNFERQQHFQDSTQGSYSNDMMDAGIMGGFMQGNVKDEPEY